MSKNAQNFFLKYGDLAYKALIVVGFVGILYLNTQFVRRTEFQTYIESNQKSTKESSERLENKLSDLSDKLAILKESTARIDQKLQLDQTTMTLSDHENRIRSIEKYIK